MPNFAGLPEGFPVGGVRVERVAADGRWWVFRLIAGTVTYGRNKWVIEGIRDTREEADRLAMEVL